MKYPHYENSLRVFTSGPLVTSVARTFTHIRYDKATFFAYSLYISYLKASIKLITKTLIGD